MLRKAEPVFPSYSHAQKAVSSPFRSVLTPRKADPAFSLVLHSSHFQVIENGISYSVSLEGQKTGFYADQRENRRIIYSISSSQRVLDVCCYSGGFALNAAAGGADDVIGVDSSAPALELAKENVQLNNLDPGRISFSKEDASEFMKRAASKNDTWDLVILDPPKLAPRRKVLFNDNL
ncbi:hypothetical protein KSP40_PGU021780 [Platanthera guangdongensis]|uniref:S-adenosylmethionine-dependent methyltransferase domain-containing protein n=1 Tax=Platanthera guangdongensis TaxID=2320717 RepID=A0ABR2N3H6_9ASPA